MERVLGQASIDIRAKDKNFRDDLKRMLRNIKDVAVDVNLIPQTQKAENDIKNFVNNENKKKHTIKVNVKVDFNDARQKIKEFKDSESSKKPGTVKFNAKVDFSEARKNISDFGKEQSNRKPITLKAKMTFAEARKDIRNFRDSLKPIPLKSKLSVDPKEANDVIRDIRTRQANATPTLLRMKAVVSFGEARSQIASFKKEVREKNKALILIDADTKRAEESFRRMERSLQRTPVYVPVRYVDIDTGEVAGGPPTEGMNSGDSLITREALTTLRTQLDPVSMALLEAQLKTLSRDRITKSRVVADVDSSSAAKAEGTLNTIARDRTSTIKADVDRDSIKTATKEFYRQYNDMFGDALGRKMNQNPISRWLDRSGWGDTVKAFGTAMTGTVPFDWIRDGIKDIMGNMESMSFQAGKTATAFGSIGSALSAAGGFAANLVTDISQVAGIAALLPAAFAANQFRVWTKQMVFSGMQTAIFSNNAKRVKEALEGMSPVMRDTAEYLRGFMGELQDLTQTSYWDVMGIEIRETAEILKGTLFKGFEDLAEIMALNHIEVLKQVVAFEKMGRFKETFSNINESFERMRPAIGDSTEALLTLIYEGSKKLIDFSGHLNTLAKNFNEFIQASSKNGAILGWIDTAFRRISELGNIVWDTVRIIGAIGEAAEKAGLGGLTELTNAFDRLANYATSPGIQSILIDVFRDSKIGVGQLADGLSTMWDGFISKMPQVTQIFIDASTAVGDIMEGIGTMFRDSTMMEGFAKLSGSVRKAIEDLQPAFKYIGDIIGDLAEMGGVIIESLAPGIETAAKMIHTFLQGFKDGFIKLVPVLQTVAESFHHLFMTPVRLAGEAIGGLMTAISQLPPQVLMFFGAMGMIIPAMSGWLKFKSLIKTLAITEATGRLSGFIGTVKGIGTAGSKIGKGFSDGFRTIRRGAAITTAGVGNVFSSMGSNITASMAATVGAFDVSANISDKAKSGASGVSTAWKGVKTQAKGVGKIFGGLAGAFKPFLPGAAIAVGLGVAVTALADSQAGADAAKESVKTLADAFVSDGFKTGEQYLHNLNERMKDIGTDWFTDWNWSDTFMESAEKVGVSADRIKEIFSGTKAEVKESAGSWNHFAVEAEKAYNNVATSGNGYVDRTKVLHGVIDKLSDRTVKGLGMSREELKKMASESPGAFKNYIEGMGQLGEEQLEALNNIKSLREELTALSNDDFDIIPSSVWESAENNNESLKQALMDANTQVERMSENFSILNDDLSTYEQKLSAFKDNLKLSGAETFSDTGGLKEYYSNLNQISDSYDKIKASIKGNVDELIRFDSSSGKVTAEFQFQSQAARDLHDSLTKHAEGIHGVAVAAYDSALKSGKTVQEAVQAAKDASAPMVEEMKQKLKEMGITSEEQINAILDGLGLLPEDIAMALDVEGADEAKRQIVETQLAAEAISTGNYKVYLSVMTDDAKNALKEFLEVDELNEKTITAALDKKGFNMEYDEFMAQVAMSSDPVKLVAQLQDEASAGLSSIQKEKESLESKAEIPVSVKNEYDTEISKAREALSTLKNNPTNMEVRTNAQEAASEALTALKKIQEENPDINISATIEELESAVGSAKSMLFSIEDRKAIISAVDEATPVGFAWNSMSVENKEAVLGVVDEFSSKITGFNSMTLKDQNAVIRAIDEAKPKADAWQALTLEEKKAILSVTDHASGYVDAYNNNKKIMDKYGNMLPNDEVSAIVDSYNLNKHLEDKVGDFLLGTDQVSVKLDSINTKELYDKVVEIYGEDKASDMFEYIRSLPLPDREMLLKAIDAGASGEHDFINSLPYQNRIKELIAEDKNAQHWHNVINKLPYDDRDKKLTATDLATTVHNAINNIPFPGKDWLLTATDLASGKVRDVDNMKINNKSFSITAVIQSIQGKVSSAVSAAKSWANRVFRNEDGAIYNGGGIQTFADGGVTMSKAMKSIQAFSGGSERHVAQIARGQYPYRVWAEPETGGEAYIPLAKSKRKRSMRILEQVARHFGTNLMKFNNGGVYKGKSIGGGVMSYASGGSDLAEALANDRKAIADGFNSLKLDIKSMFGATEKSPLGKSMEGIEKTLRDFASEYRRSAPGERAKALKALARVTAQSKTSSFWGRRTDIVTSNIIAKDARSRIGTSKLQYNPKYTLADMEKALSIVSKELEEQKAVLEKIKSDRDSMQKSIADNLFSSFNLSDTVQSADSTGWRAPTSSADIATYAKNKLATMKKYNSRMKELIKAGYNKAIIMDIASMKPEDAIYLADALLKDKTSMSTINSTYTEMFGAYGNKNINGTTGDGYVAGLANITGKTLADSFYGVGISTRQGLVNGLTKDVSALERAARFMAEALTKSFKDAMGIKSPSRVMMNLAKFIPQGVALGIDGGRSEVSKSMGRLVNPYDLRLTSGSSDLHTSKSNGIMGGRTSAGAVVNVYPSQGLSETQIGEAASRELLFRLDY